MWIGISLCANVLKAITANQPVSKIVFHTKMEGELRLHHRCRILGNLVSKISFPPENIELIL